MEETHSQVDIAVPATLVWAILADFRTYGRWNPLIRSILGHPETGRTIEIRVRSTSGSDLRSRPQIVCVREAREMRWLERWRIPGLFFSERRFWLEPLPQGGVRFHHDERAHGVLVALTGHRHRTRGKPGFDAMNAALKQRAERAWVRRADLI